MKQIIRVHEYRHEEQLCICSTKDNDIITMYDTVSYRDVLRLTAKDSSGNCSATCPPARIAESQTELSGAWNTGGWKNDGPECA